MLNLLKSLPRISDKLNQTQIATSMKEKKFHKKNNENAVYNIISFFHFLNLPLLTTIDGGFEKAQTDLEQKNHKTELPIVQAIWQNCSARSTSHIAMSLKTF